MICFIYKLVCQIGSLFPRPDFFTPRSANKIYGRIVDGKEVNDLFSKVYLRSLCTTTTQRCLFHGSLASAVHGIT